MRIAYFDCFSGISGDMTLAALVSAGWPFERLESLPGRLGHEGVRVSTEPARRGPFAATRVVVAVEGRQPHRHLRHVLAAIDSPGIEPAVKERAGAVFTRLAKSARLMKGFGAMVKSIPWCSPVQIEVIPPWSAISASAMNSS